MMRFVVEGALKKTLARRHSSALLQHPIGTVMWWTVTATTLRRALEQAVAPLLVHAVGDSQAVNAQSMAAHELIAAILGASAASYAATEAANAITAS
jgi:hypothetical protein